MTNPVMKQDSDKAYLVSSTFGRIKKRNGVVSCRNLQVEFTVKRVTSDFRPFLPTHDVIILSCQKISSFSHRCKRKAFVGQNSLRFLFGHSARAEHTEEQFQQEHLLWQAQLPSGCGHMDTSKVKVMHTDTRRGIEAVNRNFGCGP